MASSTILSRLCPICHGSDAGFVSRHSDFPGTAICSCARCNHWFAFPEPDGPSLARYYREIYSGRRASYFSDAYYSVMEQRAAAQIRFIERSLDDCRIQAALPGRTAIDWGCGVGALVAALQRYGVVAVGYDSDLAAIEIGRQKWGTNIWLNTSDDVSRFRHEFDLLLLSHTLEHFAGIEEAMRRLLTVVRPGGWVFIEVPNSSAGLFTDEMDHESHLHFFSRQSLMLLLQRLGVRVLTCVSCGPSMGVAVGRDGSKELSGPVGRAALALRLLYQRMVPRRRREAGHIETMYDGFYERYQRGDDGLWLRCLGRI
jgi:2-polyprenyl-3-methyl-5-hydroxy-6-metoxy-1,4-benzoquinol methylase